MFCYPYSARGEPALLLSLSMNATEFLSESFVWLPVQEDIDSVLCDLSAKQTELSIMA